MEQNDNTTTLDYLAKVIDEHFDTTERDCILVIGREGANNIHTCAARSKQSMAIEIARSMMLYDELRDAIILGSTTFFELLERKNNEK